MTMLASLIFFSLRLSGCQAAVLPRATDDITYGAPPGGWENIEYPDDAGANLDHYPAPPGGWENVDYPPWVGEHPTSGSHDPGVFWKHDVPGWMYYGCWSAESQRALTTAATHRVMGGTDNMTVEGCVAACEEGGYALAGVQDGARCYCSKYLPATMKRTTPKECNVPCRGNKNQYCGAKKRLDLYYPSDQEPPVRPEQAQDAAQSPDEDEDVAQITPTAEDTPNPATQKPATSPVDSPEATASKPVTTPYGTQKPQDTGNAAPTTTAEKPDPATSPKEPEDAAEEPAATSTAEREPADQTTQAPSEVTPEKPATTADIPQPTATIQADDGPRDDEFAYASGPAAGVYEFLIGGPVIPLLTQPARNGKTMLLEKWGTGPDNSTGAYEFDPSQADSFEAAFRTLNPVTDIFCAAGVTLPDRVGRQLNIGGWDNQALFGLRLYWPDGAPGVPGTNNWEEDLDRVALLAGRWYPSAMNMANGSVLVVGGEDGPNGPPQPNLEVVPSPNGELVYADWLQRTDPYNLYPFLFVLPSGGIFIAYHNEARILSPATLGTEKVLPNMPAQVADGGRTYPFEGTGMALPMYAPYEEPMEIIVCGGSSPSGEALDDCVSMTPDAADAEWVVEKMPSKRVMSCMAPLPDGSLMIMNGAQQGVAGFDLSSQPNLNAVHYDPSKPRNRRMTVMANTTIARMYHSEATLMDDGRILVSGSDPQDPEFPQEYRYEVYTPPNLMGDPVRPAMELGNLDWGYGEDVTFPITPSGSGAPASDYRVSLVAAISSTHGASMGHRTLFPALTCTAASCTVQSPPGPNIAPPGWYQVFLLDGRDVPSTAAWVRIGGDPAGFGDWPDNEAFSRPGPGPVEALF